MATAKQFEDLGVWQDARILVREIYSVANQRGFALSRRIAKFISYLQNYPHESRVRRTRK
jgi:hypothetical protein